MSSDIDDAVKFGRLGRVCFMSNEIVFENQRPGTPLGVWDLSGPASTNIEGFTTDISVDHGNAIDFKINTDSTNYRVDIYRLGFYGGDGARLVTSINHTGPAVNQPAPLTNPANGLIDAGNWQVTDTWNVPADAVSGVYIAKLVRQDGIFGENHVPFIVRDDDGQSDIVFQTDDATWQAYNSWGGTSFYPNIPGAIQAPAISYNRPMDALSFSYYVDMELPAIMWLEKNGYDVSYMTNVDTARNGGSLLDHKVFLTVGKDEYWSAEQFASVQAARDAGVNLQFWTGNDIFWKTEWQPSIDGTNTEFRTLISYKENEPGVNPSGVWTGLWANPNAPEGVVPPNALTGNLFEVIQTTPYLSPIVIPYEQTQLRFWRNTSIADTQPGATVNTGIASQPVCGCGLLVSTYLGPEWNTDQDNGYRPAGLINLSDTTIATDYQVLDYSNNAHGPGTATHSLTLYRDPSGALVFGAGTMYWSWALEGAHAPLGPQNPPPDLNVQQAMVNFFADMGVQPATLLPELVAASPSTDTAAPSVAIAELNVNSSGGLALTLTGSASDLGGRVAGVEVSTDGGAQWHPATGGLSWTYSSSGLAPTDIMARGVDDSLNIGHADGIPANVLGRAIADGLAGGAARAVAIEDTLNDQSWSVVWNNYDFTGNWIQQSIAFDDNSGAVASLDPLNNNPWSLVWDNYDVAGNWIQQSIAFDDTSSAVASLDPSNNNPWSLVWDNYDVAGNWIQQSITFDNNSSAVASLDPSNNNPWSLVWDNFNGTGDWISQSIEYDDGTHGLSNIDWANTSNWYSDTYISDASNNLISHYQQMDDGSIVHL